MRRHFRQKRPCRLCDVWNTHYRTIYTGEIAVRERVHDFFVISAHHNQLWLRGDGSGNIQQTQVSAGFETRHWIFASHPLRYPLRYLRSSDTTKEMAITYRLCHVLYLTHLIIENEYYNIINYNIIKYNMKRRGVLYLYCSAYISY